MNLQGNLTVYDFYKALRVLTDGWQMTKLPVSLSLTIQETKLRL